MPVATADQIRNRPIFVTIAGTVLQIECRRPEPLDLIAHNVLPLPVFHDVLHVIATWSERAAEPSAEEMDAEVSKNPGAWGQFIDRWACAAAVNPHVVQTEAEVDTDPSSLWIEDLPFETRLEILRQTNRNLRSPKLKTAVTDFRRVQPADVGA
jgi:hypothetical protein